MGEPFSELGSSGRDGEERLVRDATGDCVFGNGSLIRLIATTQWLGRRITREQRRAWMSIETESGRRWVDQVRDADDPQPAVADWILRRNRWMRRPQKALRVLFGSA
jgi:hypothetical protein